MGLLERVTALLRANLNDLIDRAEEPEKVLKQVMLDMQNQMLQVKTQVAMAVADQHLLEKKLNEHRTSEADYLRRAELALDKGREDLARHAAEQSLNYGQLIESVERQLAEQRLRVEHLKTALLKLEVKLREAQTRSELLLAQQRRARALDRAIDAQSAAHTGAGSAAFTRMQQKVQRTEAVSLGKADVAATDDLDEELLALDKRERIDEILDEIRRRRGAA